MKYLDWKPTYSDNTLLIDAYEDMQMYSAAKASSIPLIIQLFENPKYDFLRFGRLPGSIDLFGHDILHILLSQNMAMKGEAYVIGYTMGSTKKITHFDIVIFKLISQFLYPRNYRFNAQALEVFIKGIEEGFNAKANNLNKVNFNSLLHKPLSEVRNILCI